MRFFSRWSLAAALLALLVSGCANHQGMLPTAQPLGASFQLPRSTSNTYLFANGSNGTGCASASYGLAAYSLSGKSTSVSLGGCDISAIAFDRNGNLYVGGFDCDGNGTIGFCEYTAPLAEGEPASLVLPQNAAPKVGSLATDKAGNWYAIEGNQVAVYAPLTTTVVRRLTKGLKQPDALAFDSKSNLYVANRGNNTVTVYKAGSTSLLRTIHNLDRPSWLAFDSKGNLYVANNGSSKSVAVFGPNATTPLLNRTIKYDIVFPIDMVTVDANNDLYVAIGSGHGGDEVIEYHSQSNTVERTLTSGNGICNPGSIAVDPAGNLYVANQCGGSKLLRFSPGGTTSNKYAIQPYSIVIAKSVLR